MTADLEIGVYRWEPGKYTVDLRFESSGEGAGRRRQSVPVSVPFDRLRGLAGDPEGYGRALWEAVFTDPAIRTAYGEAVAAALSQPPSGDGPPLRVRLYISPNAPELHGLRWEALFNPAAAGWVATDE